MVILCETRAHHLTAEKFKSNLIDPLDADLALCVTSGEQEDRSNPFYRLAEHVWPETEPQDWIQIYDDIGAKFGNPRGWRVLLDVPCQWLGPMQPGSGAILWYFRWRLYERLAGLFERHKYAWVILTRSDFMFDVPHIDPRILSPDLFYVPDGEHYGGITDRHLVAPAHTMLRLLETVLEIWTRPLELARSMSHRDSWNPEQFLLHQIERRGFSKQLSFLPYAMYCVRDETVETRWSRGEYFPNLGYFVKYPTELQKSWQWRDRIASSADWKQYLEPGQLV